MSVAGKILNEVGRNSSRLKSWPAYIFAAVATLATFELRMALAGQLGGEPTLVIFTVPIMLSAHQHTQAARASGVSIAIPPRPNTNHKTI